MNLKEESANPLRQEAAKLLEDCATVIQIPVAWGDMNAALHVSNTVYFQYFETARVHFFEQVNFVQRDSTKDIGIVIASISCKFRIPLVYPDTLTVGTKICSIQEDRFTMKHLLVSHTHQKLAAEGEAVIVTYNYKQQCKAPVPHFLIERINNIQNHR
ncbi:MAG: acyl-CoA thioesterase [Desulfamplus sp.]|nr:acyl-CoA thioesterase [Desulfamplus sp.]